MSIIFPFITIGFFLWAIQRIFFWTYFWQLKEYRLDRMSVHLRETKQGRSIIFSPIAIFNVLLFLTYGLVIFNDSLSSFYQIIVGSTFILLGIKVISNIIRNRLKLPTLTGKAFSIIILSITFISFMVFLPLTDVFVWLVFVTLITPLVIAGIILFFSFPTEIYRDLQIEKAKSKLKNNKNLLVIAVSGSYGKSSTKEYMAHILSRRFRVVKTPFSNNTPIGIAKTVLKKIEENTEIFIVEMGAYKKGEILELSQIVYPKISITTSISDQHLSLFGSLDNAISTEKELIDSLAKDGIAFFNGNNKNAFLLSSQTKKKSIIYKVLENNEKIEIYNKNNTFLASDVEASKNGVSFFVIVGKRKAYFKTTLLGGHIVENILPSIYIGLMLGMSMKQIQQAVLTLQSIPKTMAKITLQNNVVVIDDTFNASPESVLSAISYIKLYKRNKKIFVLTPLIELGEKAKERHYQIGKELSKCDYIFLTNKNYYKEIMKGIYDVKSNCIVSVGSPLKIAQEIQSIAFGGDIVIFEGKEANNILTLLL